LRFLLTAFLALLAAPLVLAQPDARPLRIDSDPAAYEAEASADPSRRMVDLAREIPGIVLDIRYATSDNFMGRRLYDAPRAFLRASAAQALHRVQDDLRARGLGLKVWDSYRPYSVTVRMWREHAAVSGNYLAPPTLGSDHNRGIAIDVSLVDLATGRELAMPTGFDDFSPRAWRDYGALPLGALYNRTLLREAMEAHGFHGLESEWWHYAYRGAKTYSVLDLPFSVFDSQ
jgi:D-alanyl-D-alanine dipeptidase